MLPHLQIEWFLRSAAAAARLLLPDMAKERTPMSERNKAHMQRVIEEIYNRGNLAVVDELAASDLLIHTSSDDIRGRDGAKGYVTALRAAFPDLHFKIEQQIAEGDVVMTRWTARGTHRGEFQGIPATGKVVRMTGSDIDRIVDGKTVECWAQVDELSLLQQLGVIQAGGRQ
jgi:steroid delta-isomerase-like uncharacterized protein